MFWDNLLKLCVENNTTPTATVQALGISKGSVTHWKNGKTPHGTTLQKLADYFGVSTETLLQGTEASKCPAPSKEPPSDADEQDILRIYRSLSRKDKHKFMTFVYEFENLPSGDEG